MLKTVLNTNIIPHTWKLANIVPIPKPNKDIDEGTSYRPIYLLSVFGEEPSSLHNRKHTKHTHATWVPNTTLYSNGTTHTKQHRSKGVQPNSYPARTITVALDMSKAFDTISIHTLIRKLLQTKIPGTIIKLKAYYIKGRKAYTTYINYTSSQRQFQTGVPQGGVRSPTLFNIYTADIPPHRAPVQVMAYADDITITSTHINTSAAKNHNNNNNCLKSNIQCIEIRVQWTVHLGSSHMHTYINTYIKFGLDKTKQSHTKSRQNNLHSVHSRPCRMKEQYGPQNKQ